jgi:peptide/nickel transport system substrate-binding protein
VSPATGALPALIGIGLMLAACTSPARTEGPGTGASAPEAAGPTRIVVAIMSNPPYLYTRLAGTGIGPGAPALQQMLAVTLADLDANGGLRPMLAESVPSIENGLWKVFPDGRMETTWKIRPGARWHDSTPFTSDDVLFTASLLQDRELTLGRIAGYSYVDRLEAPDPQTVVLTWKEPFIGADALFVGAPPLPKHLLAEAYADSKANFPLLSYWTDGFVSTGPYRLQEWVRDSHLILRAFDGYALGRAKIDEVEVRLIPDDNAFIANILAGEILVTLGQSISFEQGQQLGDRWTGGKIENYVQTEMKMWPQFVNPTPAIVTDVRFRKALMHALNRQEMADVIMDGASPIAHSVVQPTVPEYGEVQDAAVKYEYDPRRAVQMIEGLGYVRGADGMFRDAANQVLTVNIQTTPEDHNLKPMYAVADNWARIGVASDLDPIPPPRQRDVEYRANFPTFNLQSGAGGIENLQNMRGVDARLPENNYSGRNYARYMNAEFDTLLDRYLTTIPREPRIDALRQVIRHMTDQVVIMTLYYRASPTMVSNRLRNVGPDPTWNAQEWTLVG